MSGENDDFDGEEIPDHVKEHMKSGKKQPEENFGPEDVSWPGIDGKADSEKILLEYGHDSITPLVWILSAIIKAYPVQGPKSIYKTYLKEEAEMAFHKRLRTALTALTGVKKFGRNPVDDSDLLLEIGWRYHSEYYELGWGPDKPELRRIVKAVITELAPERQKERTMEPLSLIQKLEDKFQRDIDIWSTRAAEDNDYDRMNIVRATRLVIEQLNKLGIAADKSAVKPNSRRSSLMPLVRDETR
jgi:hypothetical protein